MKKLLFSIISISSFIIPVFSQSTLQKTVERWYEETKNRQASTVNLEGIITPANAASVWKLIVPYTKDSIPEVRYQVLSIISTYSRTQSFGKEWKENAIVELIQATKDKTPFVAAHAWEHVLVLTPKEYGETSLSLLPKYEPNQTVYPQKWARWIAIHNQKSQVEKIKTLQSNEKDKSKSWEYQISLSRLGDATSTENVLAQIQKIPVNDEWVESLAPDLTFTKNKAIYTYLLDLLLVNEKNCISPNPDYPVPVVCGYRIMEYLAGNIKDFPAEKDITGDLIGDYNKNLANCKSWYTKNKTNFSIIY